MCISPRILPGSGQVISCRVCWQCRHARVSDWVGRCIAEQRSVDHCHVATLTYGGDDRYQSAGLDNIHAQTLIFDDVRNWLKRMRHVAPLRYLCAGEFGERKGRSHWHVLCFWKESPPPDLRLRENYIHSAGKAKLWEHGFTYWDEMTTKTIRYCVKYAVKDVEKTRTGRSQHFSLSTNPPLGREYFKKLAFQYVEAQLAPQDLIYRFAEEINPSTGRTLEFYLQRTAAKHYLDDFIHQWVNHWGNDHWPQSDLIDEHIDSMLAERELDDRYLWMKSEEKRGIWHGAVNRELVSPRVNTYLESKHRVTLDQDMAHLPQNGLATAPRKPFYKP